LLAEGTADFYPRYGRTMEWDTAAGQAILEAAGGIVTTEGGDRFSYGKLARGLDNPSFIAAAADNWQDALK
jgi:3'-phosphoadenosine 5'-phosphosulfate (PAPS) 3'-phosphatase